MLDWKVKAEKHAKDEFPSEVCGLVVCIKGKEKYIPCKNLAINPLDHFIIDPEDWAEAEDSGTIMSIFHSHPYQSPLPSEADKAACELTKLPWYIYGVGVNTWHNFAPVGYKAPLIGRRWVWGVHDCWTLTKDYYESKGIMLRDWKRPNDPEEFRENPYFDKCFEDTGFRQLGNEEALREGDSLLFSLNSTGLNHVGVYLGKQMVLHHIQGRLSSKDFYGEWLMKATGMRLRYAA